MQQVYTSVHNDEEFYEYARAYGGATASTIPMDVSLSESEKEKQHRDTHRKLWMAFALLLLLLLLLFALAAASFLFAYFYPHHELSVAKDQLNGRIDGLDDALVLVNTTLSDEFFALNYTVSHLGTTFIGDTPPPPTLGNPNSTYFDTATNTAYFKDNTTWVVALNATTTGSCGCANGTDGIGITPQGEWNASTPYSFNDLVTYNNTGFIALVNNTGVTPGTNSSVWLEFFFTIPGTDGINGTDGTNGVNGTDGVNGINGTNGTDGINGTDGVGINPMGTWNASVTYPFNSLVTYNNTAYIALVNNSGVTPGTDPSTWSQYLITIPGTNGINGTDGVNGINGTDGVNGINGTNGVNGINGTNGVDGINGTNGVGINPVGAWNASASYSFNDLVTYNNTGYIALVNNSGVTPGTDPSVWLQYLIVTPGINGVNGTNGINGVDGINGTNGINGIDGVNGTNGIDGRNGTDGINGINGVNGTNGVDGRNGTDGINGVNGINGTNGVDGRNGTDGINGIDGRNGTDGINGVNGTNGIDGRNGTDGINGINGINGTDGINGINGTNGIDGRNGTDGINGTNGTNGVDGVNGVSGGATMIRATSGEGTLVSSSTSYPLGVNYDVKGIPAFQAYYDNTFGSHWGNFSLPANNYTMLSMTSQFSININYVTGTARNINLKIVANGFTSIGGAYSATICTTAGFQFRDVCLGNVTCGAGASGNFLAYYTFNYVFRRLSSVPYVNIMCSAAQIGQFAYGFLPFQTVTPTLPPNQYMYAGGVDLDLTQPVYFTFVAADAVSDPAAVCGASTCALNPILGVHAMETVYGILGPPPAP